MELLQKIDQNLEQNIAQSQETFEKLLPYLGKIEYKDFVNNAKNALSNFDTDQMSLLIENFIKQLKGE